MTYDNLMIAVLSFALGVLVTDTAHDYRDRPLTPPPRAVPARPAPAVLVPYICAHQFPVSQSRGCV